MDMRTLGSFLLILGLIVVVVAGFFLRRNKNRKKLSLSDQDTRVGRQESPLWVWVGRMGAALCIAGVVIIVTRS